MRIAFDGTTLRPGRTGVGYYAEHLLMNLARECPGDEVLVFSNTAVDTLEPLPSNVRVVGGGGRPGFRLAWLQFSAPRLFDALKPDIVHFTNGITSFGLRLPSIVTIHDMSLTMYPQFHPVRRVLLKRPFVARSAHRASAVMTISHAARQDILAICGVDPARVHVVYGAPAAIFRRLADRERLDALRRTYKLPERFILYVGTIEPRKNLTRLIDAYADAKRQGALPHPLICVGQYGWRAGNLGAQIERLGLTEDVRFIGYVPFGDLPALYSMAEMFVFPSLHEGFGLPVIEAMACGTPVITARTSSLGEIAQGAAIVVDPEDQHQLAAAMVQLAADAGLREDLSGRGLQRAATFTWTRAAAETRQLYGRVAAGLAEITGAREPAVKAGLAR